MKTYNHSAPLAQHAARGCDGVFAMPARRRSLRPHSYDGSASIVTRAGLIFCIYASCILAAIEASGVAFSAQDARVIQRLEDEQRRADNRKQPARETWLQDAGFGMLGHFSLDSQLDITISHSLVGVSEDYLDRLFHELPLTFNPDKFDAHTVARLARAASMKYVVLTAKHHAGFCLRDTATTEFDIKRTPCGRDLVKVYVEAVRAEVMAGERGNAGPFSVTFPAPAPGTGYDVRAFVMHPKPKVEGDVVVVVGPSRNEMR